MYIHVGTGANPEGFYPETCQLLLQTPGLRLDTADLTYGRTAAHWAVAYQRHDLLEQLITAGTYIIIVILEAVILLIYITILIRWEAPVT